MHRRPRLAMNVGNNCKARAHHFEGNGMVRKNDQAVDFSVVEKSELPKIPALRPEAGERISILAEHREGEPLAASIPLQRETPPNVSVGLALSGGGIRSAT